VNHQQVLHRLAPFKMARPLRRAQCKDDQDSAVSTAAEKKARRQPN
jgi:hypothetical protein